MYPDRVLIKVKRYPEKRNLDYYDFTLEEIQKIYPDAEKLWSPTFDKKKERFMLPIIFKDGTRTNKQCARVVFELRIGQRLGREIHVHHVDENKLNDVFENLYLETHSTHAGKHLPPGYFGGELYCKILCQNCFKYSWKLRNWLLSAWKKGKSGPFCSRSCTGQYSGNLRKGMEPLPPMVHPRFWECRRFEDGPPPYCCD